MRLVKRWVLRPEAPDSLYQDLSQIPPIVVRALFHRGVSRADEARIYFDGGTTGSDPFELADMDRAVGRISRAIAAKETIAVYGDYDADGVTATVLLTEFLESAGAMVRPYIPNRFEEGYGLNCAALDSLAESGVRLVLSVDCGVRSFIEAEHARDIGLDLIITDHHPPMDALPAAVAVLDPKRPGSRYPERNLSGVGVAYMLARALAAMLPSGSRPPDTFLDLVAIGTIADMVPLTGENRDLVRSGLARINRREYAQERPGVGALCRVAGIRSGTIDASNVAFQLGPRLNAAGRLETAMVALNLLRAHDPSEGDTFANELQAQNRDRQQLTRQTFLHAKAMVEEERAKTPGEPATLIYAENPGFNTGIIGLAASKLLEAYCRPSVVVAVEGEQARGSVRSIPGFHITQALDECGDLLIRYGGHAAAAGFTIQTGRLPELRARLDRLASSRVTADMMQPVLEADAEVSLNDLNWDLADWLRKMQPFGQGNPAPVFIARGLQILQAKAIGREKDHLKLGLGDGRRTMEAIAFGRGEDADSLGTMMDAAFSLEEDYYYQPRLQMRLLDFRPTGKD